MAIPCQTYIMNLSCPSTWSLEFSEQPWFYWKHNMPTYAHSTLYYYCSPNPNPHTFSGQHRQEVYCFQEGTLQRKMNQEIAFGNWKRSLKGWFWNARHWDSDPRWRRLGWWCYKAGALLPPCNSTFYVSRFHFSYVIDTVFLEVDTLLAPLPKLRPWEIWYLALACKGTH